VANLGRGGRSERIKPNFPLVKLWRATAKQRRGRKAQERIRFLGRPAGGRGENPREEKAQEGRGLYVRCNKPTEDTDTRREQNPEVGRVVRGIASLIGDSKEPNNSPRLFEEGESTEAIAETRSKPQEGREA
jgi:hypothetical protein